MDCWERKGIVNFLFYMNNSEKERLAIYEKRNHVRNREIFDPWEQQTGKNVKFKTQPFLLKIAFCSARREKQHCGQCCSVKASRSETSSASPIAHQHLRDTASPGQENSDGPYGLCWRTSEVVAELRQREMSLLPQKCFLKSHLTNCSEKWTSELGLPPFGCRIEWNTLVGR